MSTIDATRAEEEIITEVYTGFNKANPTQLITRSSNKCAIVVGNVIVCEDRATKKNIDFMKKRVTDADAMDWQLIQAQIIDVIQTMFENMKNGANS